MTRVVGSDMYLNLPGGHAMPGRPIGNLFFLVPGSGKTRVVEGGSADFLDHWKTLRAFITSIVAEFSTLSCIATLIGFASGYL